MVWEDVALSARNRGWKLFSSHCSGQICASYRAFFLGWYTVWHTGWHTACLCWIVTQLHFIFTWLTTINCIRDPVSLPKAPKSEKFYLSMYWVVKPGGDRQNLTEASNDFDQGKYSRLLSIPSRSLWHQDKNLGLISANATPQNLFLNIQWNKHLSISTDLFCPLVILAVNYGLCRAWLFRDRELSLKWKKYLFDMEIINPIP